MAKRRVPTMRAATEQERKWDSNMALLEEPDTRDPAVVAGGYAPEDSRLKMFMESVGFLTNFADGNLSAMTAVPATLRNFMLKKQMKQAEGLAPALSERMPYTADDVKEVFQWFQQRYPRLMSHVSQLRDRSGYMPDNLLAGQSSALPAKLADDSVLSQIVFNPKSSHRSGSIDDLVESIGHELTHVAQGRRMGERKFRDAYDHLEDIVGYADNPFEVRAREAGSRAAGRYRLHRDTGPGAHTIRGVEPPAPVGKSEKARDARNFRAGFRNAVDRESLKGRLGHEYQLAERMKKLASLPPPKGEVSNIAPLGTDPMMQILKKIFPLGPGRVGRPIG